MIFDAFTKREDRTPPDQRERVPPGQYVARKLPVIHYGSVPHYEDAARDWNLRVWGELAEPVSFSLAAFRALPTTTLTIDVHCITRWSTLDTTWEGVRFADFLQAIPALNPDAAHIIAHAEHGFTSSLPLRVMLEAEVLLAYRHEGAELTPEHGFPLRLIVPGKYFWKSAKWLRGIEFLSHDACGFWERYGYHKNADPWQEERYADE